jgi:hypothetical protein
LKLGAPDKTTSSVIQYVCLVESHGNCSIVGEGGGRGGGVIVLADSYGREEYENKRVDGSYVMRRKESDNREF